MTALTMRMKVIVALCAMLVIGGLVEYLIILNVHSFYSHWDWTVPELYTANSGYRPHLSQLGSVMQKQDLGKKLERLGKEGVSAARDKLTGMVRDDYWEESQMSRGDAFYERREILLDRIDELMDGFESKYNERSYGSLKFGLDVLDRGDRGGPDGKWFPHDSHAANDRSGFFELPQNELTEVDSIYGPEVLLENDTSLPRRQLSPFEAAGNNIMLTLRTVKKFHSKRLPLLFSTWLSKVNRSNVFLMTDGRDPVWQNRVWKKGMHYILSACTAYSAREDRLCCRTGTEMAQIFKPENKHYDWSCHVDDDMYVRIPPLIELLAKFDPKKDAVYLGRSGSSWNSPRKVLPEAKLGTQGQGYHFAVGGMFCLSRAMLELARPYLGGGRNFTQTCTKTLEPDDVTVGFVVGVVLNKTMSRTEKIYTHGLHLISTVDPGTLDQQIAFSYGFGSTHWGYDDYNAVYVPGALYSVQEDDSQFRSLHCHLYPTDEQCVRRAQSMPVWP